MQRDTLDWAIAHQRTFAKLVEEANNVSVDIIHASENRIVTVLPPKSEADCVQIETLTRASASDDWKRHAVRLSCTEFYAIVNRAPYGK